MSDRLLIVEDDPDLAENLVELCEAQGFCADVSPSAEKAMDRVGCQPYRGIISDYRLPGQSGVELISALRRSGYALPVV
ncbi:MAG TPA: response regulator, partial [Polyangiaceae bacterium]|nr:response regulator [Polyangiaceae bacterium]